MRTAPLVRRQVRPVGIVRKGGRSVVGEWSGTSWDHVPKGARLYVLRASDLLPQIHDGIGRVRLWRGYKITSFDYHGRRVSNLRGLLPTRSAAAGLVAVSAWAEWLRAHGANVGSLAGSSWSLWRSLLESVAVVWGDEPAFDQILTGGRQGDVGAGSYSDVELWDLSAAYAHTLGTLAVPCAWKRYRHPSSAIPTDAGYVEAAVRVPRAGEWGPLPERLGEGHVIYPNDGTEIAGVWSVDELRAARRAGAEVVCSGYWSSGSHRYLFAEWWAAVEAGRAELAPDAARLVKASSNTLWAMFLTGEDVAEWVSWPQGFAGVEVREPEPRRMPPASPAVAGLVAGRVRARLYSEALTRAPVIACHTDGVIMPAGYHLEPNTGGPGRWRLTDSATRLDLIAAQSFRYRRPDGQMVYRVSGVPASHAPAAFASITRTYQKARPEGPVGSVLWARSLAEGR